MSTDGGPSPAGPLDGSGAIVLGGGSGIGLATARALARDGARVTIAGRTQPKLESAVERLAVDGLDVAWATCDGLRPDEVQATVGQAARDAALRIAVVVPGGGSISPVLLFGDDQFGAEVDRNVRPVFLFLKYAGRAMVDAGGGSFVAISSTAAAFSTRYLGSYAAGKAAVDQLVRVAADELGPFGVRVNSVRPGLTRTPATERALGDERMAAAFLAGQPIGRHGEADDIAEAVRFLAGPESSWVTGQCVAVDGGHTLRAFVDYARLVALPGQ